MSPVDHDFDLAGSDPRSPTNKDTIGLNVSDCPDAKNLPANVPFVFCPYRGRGYAVGQVTSGPFAGDWYITSSSLTIKRAGLFNRRYGPDGPVEPGSGTNFYEYNVSKGNGGTIRSLVASVRAHEKAHTDAMRAAAHMEDGNARALIEPLIAKDSNDLMERADGRIRRAADFVYNYAADGSGHLPPSDWSGLLYFWETTVKDDATGKVYTFNRWVPEQCKSEDDRLGCTISITSAPPVSGPPAVSNPTKP